MPELPEVETAMRGLEARLLGRKITTFVQRRADLRFPLPPDLPERLTGRRITSFGRRAKYILVELDREQTMLLHLGMSGRLLFDGNEVAKHEHLTFGFDDGTTLRFVDPRRFGMLDLTPTSSLASHPRMAGLGYEPLAETFNGHILKQLLKDRDTPIKVAIMNQKLVVGVGNIYACESLFRAGISPTRRAGSLKKRQHDLLAKAIREVLSDAIKAGGSSLRDYVQTDGELGYFQHRFEVYGRSDLPCLACAQPIKAITQANRSTFYCASCQN